MTDYGWFSKGLHYLALGQPMIAEAALDFELAMFHRKFPDFIDRQHVFVTGFARAGTTILTRNLYGLNEFGSLTYRDMPFVLAPICWSKISNLVVKTKPEKERIHGDGVYVGYGSPEALDEVFWRTLIGKNYINEKYLEIHGSNPELIEKFQTYVAAVLYRYGKCRYLSKNNNNILRIETIVKSFPNCAIVVPFRNPIVQSVSLLNQHRRIIVRQREDPFVKHYMTWLGHYEFGIDHKPFNLIDSDIVHHNLGSVEYWLERWMITYSYLLKIYESFAGNIVFVCYEDLCGDSGKSWCALLKRLSIVGSQIKPEFRLGQSATTEVLDHELLESAEKAYDTMRSLV